MDKKYGIKPGNIWTLMYKRCIRGSLFCILASIAFLPDFHANNRNVLADSLAIQQSRAKNNSALDVSDGPEQAQFSTPGTVPGHVVPGPVVWRQVFGFWASISKFEDLEERKNETHDREETRTGICNSAGAHVSQFGACIHEVAGYTRNRRACRNAR
jgi:hypothetical protein